MDPHNPFRVKGHLSYLLSKRFNEKLIKQFCFHFKVFYIFILMK